MKARPCLLLGVIVSLSAHAAIPMLLPGENAVRVAASSGAPVAVMGSLEDLVAGSVADTADPAETEAVEPVPVAAVETAHTRAAPVESVHRPQLVSAGVTETREPAKAAPKVVKAVSSPEAAVVAPRVEARPVSLDPVPEPALEAVPSRDTVRSAAVDEVVAAVAPPPPPAAKPAVPEHATARKRPERTRPRKTRQAGAPVSLRRGGAAASQARSPATSAGRADGRTKQAGDAEISNYKGLVLSRLRGAKRYPPKAQRRRLEGTAILRFTVSRDGRVSGGRIVRSSGVSLLDDATIAMLRRASPMPRFPRSVSGPTMTFRVPVRFSR